MLEFKKRVLEFKFNDEIYTVKYPTVKQINELEKRTKDENNEQAEVMLDFLEDLGLKKSIAHEMEYEMIQKIIKTISSAKK